MKSYYWVTPPEFRQPGEIKPSLRIYRASRLCDQPTDIRRSGPFDTRKQADEELRLRLASSNQY
jgi:hypothetical protein